MERELTRDEIETFGSKWQYCTLGLHPGNIRPLRLRLIQHTQRPIDADQLGVGRNRPVCHKLVAGPAGDIQET
jgi:hypothetical protein